MSYYVMIWYYPFFSKDSILENNKYYGHAAPIRLTLFCYI